MDATGVRMFSFDELVTCHCRKKSLQAGAVGSEHNLDMCEESGFLERLHVICANLNLAACT